MKKASRIFIFIDVALTWLVFGFLLGMVGVSFLSIDLNNEEALVSLIVYVIYLITALISAILCLIFGSRMLKDLKTDNKRVASGVLGIIFCSKLGGIFYLIWNPNK